MRIIEINNPKDAHEELEKIKADPAGIKIMAPKAVFRILKITDLTPTQANIIKQEILALGGEAAVSRGAINNSAKKSDLLLMGTLKQLYEIISKLKLHCFGLPQTAKDLKTVLESHSKTKKIKIGKKTWIFGKKTYIMGILNITPDSFSDGGKFFNQDEAYKHAIGMIEDGADIIDVGGESTRPRSYPVSAEEEIKRVIPIIKKLAKKIPISIDTYKSKVAEAALDAGAEMVNDISGLMFDQNMAGVIAKYKVPVVIMHIKGTPRNMQKNPQYNDVIEDIIKCFKKALAIARNAGILNDRILLDPGFGFGKSVEHNLEIIRRLKELKGLGYPILIGTSRKSTIGKILNLPVQERLEGTVATMVLSIQNGADVIRVHDVRQMKRAAQMTDAIVRR